VYNTGMLLCRALPRSMPISLRYAWIRCTFTSHFLVGWADTTRDERAFILQRRITTCSPPGHWCASSLQEAGGRNVLSCVHSIASAISVSSSLQQWVTQEAIILYSSVAMSNLPVLLRCPARSGLVLTSVSLAEPCSRQAARIQLVAWSTYQAD